MGSEKIKLSLLAKIVLSIFGTFLLVGLISVSFLANGMREALHTKEQEKVINSLTQQAHELSTMLSSSQQVVKKVARMTDVAAYLKNPSSRPQDSQILKVFMNFPFSESVEILYLLDKDGNTKMSTDPSLLGVNYSFREYFTEAMASRSAVISGIGVTTNLPGTYFSEPVVDSDGVVVGVAVLKVDTRFVFESLSRSNLDAQLSLMMADSSGVILHSDKQDVLYKSFGTLPKAKLDLFEKDRRYAGKEIRTLQYDVVQQKINENVKTAVFDYLDEEDSKEELLGLVKLGSFPFYLVGENDLSLINRSVNGLVTNLTVAYITSLFLGIFLLIILIRWFIAPLGKLTNYANNISHGLLDEKVEIKTSDELEMLANSMKNMVVSLKGLSRGLEDKVKEKTEQLEKLLKVAGEQNKYLEGARSAMLNVLEDLDTERQIISKEKNRIETILASIGDGVFVTDTKGVITMLNKASIAMAGLNEEEVIGKYYRDVFSFSVEGDNPKNYKDFVSEAISSGKLVSLSPRTILNRPDGTSISVSDSVAPLRNPRTGEIFGCVVVLRDSTKERELEKNKDDFISVTSHQLRTPLGSMRWNLEMVLDGDTGEITEDTKEAISQAYEGNLRMIELVNDLLDVSRIDQGRVMDEPKQIQVAEIIDNTVKEVAPIAEKKQIKIDVIIGENVPEILIDPKRLREVIENLVSNSIKYGKDGGNVWIALNRAQAGIEIKISDDGIGIPESGIPRLFGKFYRAENAVRSETEGTGLGLYVVRKFVESWGGKLKVESKLGEGSTFTILLPFEVKYIKGDGNK